MTLLCQDEREGYGEGLDLGVAYLTLGCLRHQYRSTVTTVGSTDAKDLTAIS